MTTTATFKLCPFCRQFGEEPQLLGNDFFGQPAKIGEEEACEACARVTEMIHESETSKEDIPMTLEAIQPGKATLSEISTNPTLEKPFEYFEYQDGFYAGMDIVTPQALQEQLAHQQTGVSTPACWFQGVQAGFRARALRGEDPYTTVVPMLGRPEGVQKVRVPGIILQDGDPEFAEGYAWGRDCYYDEVDTVVGPDGTEMTGTVTEEQFATAHAQKYRDITVDDVLHIFAEMQDDPKKEEERASVPCRVGMLVGYIAACIETYYDLVCKECGASPTACTCTQA